MQRKVVKTKSHAALLREVSRIERDLVNGTSADAATIEQLAEHVAGSTDDVLHGRVLSLLSRSQAARGQHALALRTTDAGRRAFARLDPAQLRQHSGLHAELLRTAGSALCKLGRSSDALLVLEQAVSTAEIGLDAAVPGRHATEITAQNALVRSLNTLGIALFSIGAIDTAIDVYGRALEFIDANAEMADHFRVDAALLRSNLTEVLHERAERLRLAGDTLLAAQDLAAARSLLDAQARLIDAAPLAATAPVSAAVGALSPYGRASYYGAWGNHLLMIAKPAEARASFERELREIERLDTRNHWGIGRAQTSIARALLASNDPRGALEHGTLALRALEQHDDPKNRSTVLSVIAGAQHALGDDHAAYDALVQYHTLRAGLEAAVAQQYASHMTAQLGLERARADALAQRRIAATLETLGRIGQEITANLDADAIFTIVLAHVRNLLKATAFTVWLLDPSGRRLIRTFGSDDPGTIGAGHVELDDEGSLVAQALRERRTVATGAERPRESALFEPLIVGERALGVASIQSRTAHAYSDNECSIFRTLATYAAIGLDNSTAYAELRVTVEALRTAQSDLAKQNFELERLSNVDMLTGVSNRRHLHERALIAIDTLRRRTGQLAVTMFDIDHFKDVNDTYGHAVGDRVLVRIAQVASDTLRPGDVIARIGGEEFAALLPDVNLGQAAVIAERIRARIAATVIVTAGVNVTVTSSFGVAAFESHTDTLDRALRRADRALYAAKAAGRDRVYVANGDSAPLAI